MPNQKDHWEKRNKHWAFCCSCGVIIQIPIGVVLIKKKPLFCSRRCEAKYNSDKAMIQKLKDQEDKQIMLELEEVVKSRC